MRDYTLYLKDIIAALESVEEFVAGMTLDEFKQDDKTSSAVIRKFEIIGRQPRKSRIRSNPNIRRSRGRKWRACGTSLSISISA